MHSWIDGSLYPDEQAPDSLDDLASRVDFLARLCASWDFGVLPDPAAIDQITEPAWQEAVDACRLLTSPMYHLLREWHGLGRLPYLGAPWPAIRDDPSLGSV